MLINGLGGADTVVIRVCTCRRKLPTKLPKMQNAVLEMDLKEGGRERVKPFPI